MKQPTKDVLGSLRVASPCGVGWDSMEGDARVRFCRLCSLNVYDFAGMTRAEVEALLSKTEGGICGRLTRRADGTVLTKDCPVGLRAVRLRATRAAGAAFAAVLSLCSLAFGQTKTQKLSCSDGGQIKVERKKTGAKTGALNGTVLDVNDAAIPNAEVVLKDESTKKEFNTRTSEDGKFSIPVLPPGKYMLRITSPGFREYFLQHFEVKAGEELALTPTLAVGEIEMGVIVSQDDFERDGGTTIFRGRMLTDLPIPEE